MTDRNYQDEAFILALKADVHMLRIKQEYIEQHPSDPRAVQEYEEAIADLLTAIEDN